MFSTFNAIYRKPLIIHYVKPLVNYFRCTGSEISAGKKYQKRGEHMRIFGASLENRKESLQKFSLLPFIPQIFYFTNILYLYLFAVSRCIPYYIRKYQKYACEQKIKKIDSFVNDCFEEIHLEKAIVYYTTSFLDNWCCPKKL